MDQGLERISTHQARLRRSWCYPFTHHRAPQWSDAIDHIKPQPSCALYWQEVGEQRPIEQINREHATIDIGAAHFFVTHQHTLATDVVTAAMGSDCELANGRGIAQTQIESLCSDRRNDMCSFSNQGNPLVGETP